MPARIVDLTFGLPDPAHHPEEVTRLAFWSGGLLVTTSAAGRLGFADITGFAVFGHGPNGAAHWMLFPKGRPRPLLVRLEDVDFGAVQGLEGRPAVDRLRAASRFIAQKSPRVAIDRSTAAFVKGQPPEVLEREPSLLAGAFQQHLRGPAAPAAASPTPRPAGPRAAATAQATSPAPRPTVPRPGVADPTAAHARPAPTPAPRRRTTPLASEQPRRPASNRPQAPPPTNAHRPPPQSNVPRKWFLLGALSGAAVVTLGFLALLLFFAVTRKPQPQPPATPPPPAPPPVQYSLSILDTPEILDLRHSKYYYDVDEVLNRVLPKVRTMSPGREHIVLKEEKRHSELGITLARREVDFYVHYKADTEHLAMRIDFVGERTLSEQDEFRIIKAARLGEWKGQVPLRPTLRSPYTVAVELRAKGLVGIAEIFRDGVSKARFTWGASSPEAARLDNSKIRAVATSPEQLFQYYVVLEQAFNVAVADLYANSAELTNIRRFPNGTAKVLKATGADYKKVIFESMPLAARRGDTSKYSDVKFTPEGDGLIRISSVRYSNLRKYESPLTMLVARQKGGHWLIVEENSESRSA